MVVSLAHLAVPFTREFLHRESKQTVRLVKRNLVCKDTLGIAILVKFMPFVKELLCIGVITGENNATVKEKVAQIERKAKNIFILVVFLVLDVVLVVFTGMQVGNSSDIAIIIDLQIKLIGNSRIAVNIKEIPFKQVAHVRLEKPRTRKSRNFIVKGDNFIFADQGLDFGPKAHQISISLIIDKECYERIRIVMAKRQDRDKRLFIIDITLFAHQNIQELHHRTLLHISKNQLKFRNLHPILISFF